MIGRRGLDAHPAPIHTERGGQGLLHVGAVRADPNVLDDDSGVEVADPVAGVPDQPSHLAQQVLAGDAFDYRIIDNLVSPWLGKGSSYRGFDSAGIALVDRPIVYLYHRNWIWAYTNKLSGLRTIPDGLVRVQGLKFN